MSGVYNQGPAREERDTTLRDLISVLFKRKWLILSLFVVVTVLVVGRTVMQEDTYSADARVLLKRQGARTSLLERNPRVLPWVEVVETELEVIKTEAVMQRAIDKLAEPTDEFPEGIEMGVFGLSRRIEAGVMNESNVLYVQGTAQEPRLAVAITNAVAEAYVEHHRELFKLPDVQHTFVTRADSVFAQLDTARRERQKILDEFGLTDFQDDERQMIRQREVVRSELIALDRTIARLEIEVEDISSMVDRESVEIPFVFNTGSIQGGSIAGTISRLKKVESDLESIRGKYTEAHPERQELERNRVRLLSDLEDGVNTLVTTKTHELRVARSEAASLRRALVEIEGRLARIPDATRRLASLNTRINALQDQYETFAEYIADSQATAGSFEDYGATIISHALRAELNAKGDLVRLALAPLLALMAGIFISFYLENMDHSLGTREDVERHLDIPVLASFPESEMDEPAPDEEAEERKRAPFRRTRSGRA